MYKQGNSITNIKVLEAFKDEEVSLFAEGNSNNNLIILTDPNSFKNALTTYIELAKV
jgi:hypothetical protein